MMRMVIERLSKYPAAMLVLLCLAAWLPGALSLPPLDRDESRFAQASKQMIESGDYVDIRYSTVPRYNKPVGIYWLQAASTRLLGSPPYDRIWTYRVPSILGALLAVLLTYWCGRAVVSRKGAFIGAALLGTSVLLSAEAEIATTDALLLAAITAVEGILLRAYLFARGRIQHAPSKWQTMAGWGALGFGLLLKGPVILSVAGLTALTVSIWDRDFRWLRYLRALPGLPLTLAVVLPWGIAIAFASHGAFYRRSLGHDLAAKIMAGQESHGAPPGYYLALAAMTFWPVTLFALPAARSAVAGRTDPVFRFLLSWIVPSWLVFEAVPTKLPHYILPLYPALALLAALWIVNRHSAGGSSRPLQIVSAVVFIGVTLAALTAVLVVPYRLGVELRIWWLFAALIVAVLAIAAVTLQVQMRLVRAAVCAAAAALIFVPLLGCDIAPALAPIWLSQTIAQQISANRAPTDPPVILAGYLEPSLVFLLGTATHLEGGQSAGVVAARQGGLAVIGDREQPLFLHALHAAGGREYIVGSIAGLDYSRGKHEHVLVFRIRPAKRQ
ncbi:MAG: glycosyltransferase family 39 protein [Alphaproteobacteria bacterium]|nr:glycosyltransferase family 39 protein [Alphaproteobacteria bacterium]MBV9062909.1 glycosyltransferase family 39 protein [Alphaproteobacteria bacterium]